MTSSNDYYHGRGVRGMMWTSPVEQLSMCKYMYMYVCMHECAITDSYYAVHILQYCPGPSEPSLGIPPGALIHVQCYAYHIKAAKRALQYMYM